MLKKLITAVFVAIILGIIGAHYLFVGSFFSLIPWGIGGLLIGAWCGAIKKALLTAGTYGFVLAFTFMLSGYQGTASIFSRLPFFAALGLVGAICGLALGAIGNLVRTRLEQRSGRLPVN